MYVCPEDRPCVFAVAMEMGGAARDQILLGNLRPVSNPNVIFM